MMEPVRVGIIGCGNISDIYLDNSAKSDLLELVACADLVHKRAQAKGKKHGVKPMKVDALLENASIELVVNLTVPKAHGEIALAALKAGKSVYNEKPLALTREEARRLIVLARRKKLLLGGAPDTFMGGGIQTCLSVINDGWIGEPVAAAAFMLCHGHETWHPDPEFFYKPGGGPMFDMGPYYLTALVTLMGPVRRVAASARASFPQRTVTSEPKRGKVIDVEVPTHVAGVLDFHSGAIATLVTSFDVWDCSHPPIELYGTLGSMQVPDPNTFGGPVKVKRSGEEDWYDVPISSSTVENCRGIGVEDMARVLREGGRHQANESLAYHVLDLMHAFHESSEKGRHVNVKSTL